jgi:hypothetical protein
MEVQSNNQGGVVAIERKPKDTPPPTVAATSPPPVAPATGPSEEEREAMSAARRAQLQSQQRIGQLENQVLNDEIARLKAQQPAPATQPANK